MIQGDCDPDLFGDRLQVGHGIVGVGVPLGYMRVKSSGSPALIPVPQSPGLVPGRVQVVTPFGTTFQPWSASRARAAATLNGYGFTEALASA